MNPYFAIAFLSALVFWIWPAFLYHTPDAHVAVPLGFAAAIFVVAALTRFAYDAAACA